MMHEVIVTPRAKKQLVKLPKNQRKKIQKRLINLELNPLLGKKLSDEMEGLMSYKIWPYRVFYFVEKEVVWIVSILHRQGAYK
jgi:mRNA-degrading endonuclease RelE of RelBE toxin-antitoxin system